MRQLGSPNEPFSFRLWTFGKMKTFREGASMQLNKLAAGLSGSLHLLLIRGDEKTHIDAGLVHLLARFGDRRAMTHDIEPAFSSHFLTPFRNNTNNVRFEFERDLDDLGNIAHFEVQTC